MLLKFSLLIYLILPIYLKLLLNITKLNIFSFLVMTPRLDFTNVIFSVWYESPFAVLYRYIHNALFIFVL